MNRTVFHGVVKGMKYAWIVVGIVGTISWVSILFSDNPLSIIEKILLYLTGTGVAICLLLIPYFIQKETTKGMENWGKGLEKELQKCRDENEQLRKKLGNN